MHVNEVASMVIKYRVEESLNLKDEFLNGGNFIKRENFLFFRDKTGWYCRKTLKGIFEGGRVSISLYNFGKGTDVVLFVDAGFLSPAGKEGYEEFKESMRKEIESLFLELTGTKPTLIKELEHVLVGRVEE